MNTQLHNICKTIIHNDYTPIVKHRPPRLIYKYDMNQDWVTYRKPNQCEKTIINTIKECAKKYPHDDIALRAYEKDTNMLYINYEIDYTLIDSFAKY